METTAGGQGWTNDIAPRIVRVVVSGDPLTATVASWSGGGGAVFTNTYETPTVEPPASPAPPTGESNVLILGGLSLVVATAGIAVLLKKKDRNFA